MSNNAQQHNESDTDSGLPEGWTLTKLGDLCTQPQYGWTTSANKNGTGLKLLRTTDISGGTVDWSTVPACAEEPDDPQKYLLTSGDILVSRAGSVGLSYLVKECSRAIFASYLIRFRPKPPIKGEFIALFLRSPEYWTSIADQTSGIAIPNVNASKLKQLEIPLPPLAEQKRIVVKVEELLARVNSTKERLAKVSMILKRFRQAVLSAACSGRLTTDWREKMNSVSEEYQKLTMADIGIVSGGITKNSKRQSLSLQVPYLRVANVYENLIDLKDVREIGITPQEFERTILKGGDILIVEGNGSLDQIGRVAIWKEQVKPCVHQNHLIKFRASELVTPRYALFWLMSPLGREYLMEAAVSTAGLHNLSISKIEKLPISVPTISEQYEIVRRVEAMFKLADAVEKRVAAATLRAEKLTQAILGKAFRGELVPTEAELARRERRSYETASELLALIKSQRESKGAIERRRDNKTYQGGS